jgi:hypothetical protein
MTVPTLLLSYSSKSIGMSEYVYGNRKWVLPVDASTESTLDAAKALLGQSAAIRSFLRERMVSIRADAFGIVDVLESVL